MSRPNGNRTVKIILGEVLFDVFSNNPDTELTIGDIKVLVQKFEIKTTNLGEIIRRDYNEVIQIVDDKYKLSTDWKIEGLLYSVNVHRTIAKIPLLELPQPNLKERSGS